IGPITPVGLQLTSAGMVSTSIGDTVVTFDGVPAPLIYVSPGQVNAIVPYEVAGKTMSTVVVTHNGTASSSISVNFTDTAPGIFSLSMTGTGQGAILNQDATVNGANNAAARGSVIVIYATGEGVLNPAAQTGSVTPSTGGISSFPVPVGNVKVTIG